MDVDTHSIRYLRITVGGVAQESEAMGSPYAERGAITDEAIAIMKELWTKEDPSFSGKYHRFSGMPFSPKPLQKPHIPVLIGGNSHAAIRRAVRLGNGWHPFSISPEAVSEGINYLRECAQGARREVAEIPISVSLPLGNPTTRGDALGTTPYAIVQKIQAFARVGVQTVVITGNIGNIAETITAMEMLAREVLPVFQ
jgi:alkanesulfonate monooxygenase SsuD/methylene tetrahydromethanopterin reductase-like flavin-dependent oxidoreductase (luciferase family)